jgi:hypothetical protein
MHVRINETWERQLAKAVMNLAAILDCYIGFKPDYSAILNADIQTFCAVPVRAHNPYIFDN